MNIFELGIRSVLRKRVKTILLMLIIFFISLFIFAGWACKYSSVQTLNGSRQAIGKSFRLEANEANRHKKADELSKEIGEGNGSIGGYHHLPCGGNDITAALADELEVRYDEAEQLKRSVVITEDEGDMIKPPVCRDKDGRRIQFAAKLVCNIVETALDEICRMIKLTEEDAGSLLVPRSKVYLTGGGIAMLRGGAGYLEKYLGRKVQVMTGSSNKLGSPEYASVLGLVDLIFNSIEQRYDEQETLPMRVADTFKGLFGKTNTDE